MAKTKTKARMIERARSEDTTHSLEEEESDDEDTSRSEEVESGDDEEVAITVVGKFGGKELKSSLRKQTRNNKEDEVDRGDEVAVGLKSRGKVLKRSLQDETSADNSEDEMESNDVAVGLKLKPNQQHLTSRYLQKRARKEGESSEVAVEPRSRGKVFNPPPPPPKNRITLRVSRGNDSSSTSSTPSSSDDDDDDDDEDDDDDDDDDTDDDDDEDEDDEEEKMGSQSDIHISVQLIPLFQLHCQLEDKLHYQPNTKACKFNCRGLDISRLTCMDPLDNMPSKLRAEEQNANISVVDGVVVVVVTSFSEATEPGVISLPMTSVAFPEGDATHYATPLELDTINEANRWLRGIAFEKSEEHGKQATTVEEGLKEYITLLENQVPKQISAQDLRNFITDHHWPADCWGFNQCE